MKISLLTQWFDPEPGPAAIPGILAREFAAMGHEVNVLTGFPNYPDGKIYPGFKQKWKLQEKVGELSVVRVRLYPSHDASPLRRIANYTSFGTSALVSGRKSLRHSDAVWVYNSPITVSMPLLAHTRMGKVPYFLHVQDLWPDSLIQSGMFPSGFVGKVAGSLISRIVRLTERKSTVIGVISPSVRDLILERNPGLDPDKIVFVPNPTDEALFQPVENLRTAEIRQAAGTSKFEVMYMGAIGEVQGLSTLLDAAEILKGEEGIQISLVGDGISRKRLMEESQARGLGNVRFVDRVPMSEVPFMAAQSDVQLVSLAGADFLRYTMPSKITSLLSMGVPIIGHLAGDGAQVIEDSGSGPTVEPGDADALAAAIRSLSKLPKGKLRKLGSNGRLYYEKHLSAGKAASLILESLEHRITNPD